jgi:uncharacterized phage-associated protein
LLVIQFRFNLDKTLAAAAVLLQEHHGRMEYFRLLKLLYIADRELLAETGQPLTGDDPYAMKRGPVLSRTYDLIKAKCGETIQRRWLEVVRTDGREVTLASHPGLGKLNRGEVRKLQDLCLRYRDSDGEDLSDLTHDFGEWQQAFGGKNPTSSYPISWESVLTAQGLGELSPRRRDGRLQGVTPCCKATPSSSDRGRTARTCGSSSPTPC